MENQRIFERIEKVFSKNNPSNDYYRKDHGKYLNKSKYNFKQKEIDESNQFINSRLSKMLF